MQKITRDQLIEKASELLENGTVSCVLGWGAGEFGYDVTPALFKTAEALKSGFVFGDFCGANFSKYYGSFIKQQLNTYVPVHFWALYSDPWVYVSFYATVILFSLT